MRRGIVLFALAVLGLPLSFGYEWQTEEQVREIREGIERQLTEGKEYPISAVAVCEDMEDMSRVARVGDIEDYFVTITMMGYEPIGELYLVFYMEAGKGFPRILGSIYRMDGTIEWYYVD